jgi:N-alpha-acetyltransferase 40
MVKSKQLKVLRKQLASVLKCAYDVKDHVRLPSLLSYGGEKNVRLVVVTDVATEPALDWCQKLFERNMGEMYRQSSWGLDMDKKRAEWTHKTSRFILLTSSASSSSPRENGEVDEEGIDDVALPQLEAFINYRFLVEDEYEAVVLYVYELQVQTPRRGYGQCLMNAMASIGRTVGVERVMLTVFRNNTAALSFYEQLSYQVDETSPDDEDYLILSKNIFATVGDHHTIHLQKDESTTKH